jgi:hypothetical protein
MSDIQRKEPERVVEIVGRTHSNWLEVNISSGNLWKKESESCSTYTREPRTSKEVPKMLSLTKDIQVREGRGVYRKRQHE